MHTLHTAKVNRKILCDRENCINYIENTFDCLLANVSHLWTAPINCVKRLCVYFVSKKEMEKYKNNATIHIDAYKS